MIELINVMGDDLMVVNAARVSMRKQHTEFDPDKDARLIKYLANSDPIHWTPFAHPQVQFRIKAPIFVARQWFRSTVGTARNEVSRRYVDDEPELFDLYPFRARPADSIKQGSSGALPGRIQEKCADIQSEAHVACLNAYNEMLALGVAPEQARAVLPQTMMTEWIETASLWYWARFVRQRADVHAQVEIQQYAQEIWVVMHDLFPVSWDALMGVFD